MQPAEVVAAIHDAGVQSPSVVSRAEQPQYPHDDDTVLQVHWSETNALGGPLSDGAAQFISVTIHHVPVIHLAEIRRAMSEDGVPSLIGWLRDAERAPEGWRITGPHGRAWHWKHDGLVTEDT
jgi:hypothetical protein